MSGKRVSVVIAGLGLAVALGLTGCGPSPRSASAPQMAKVTAKGVEAPAEATVAEFYRWYVDTSRDPQTGEMRNPIRDGALRTHAAVAPELVDAVEADAAAMTNGGADPILCAQDVPGEVRVEDAVVSGDEATVAVHGVWNAGTEFEMANDLSVRLRMGEGGWPITGVACGR